MGEADELLCRRLGLGTLAVQAGEFQSRLQEERGSTALGESALSGAELRLLPILATHLSFPQIAEVMFLSRHAVKPEALSICRKLGARSRNRAVGRARDIGLPGGDGPGRAGGEISGGPASVTAGNIPDAALSPGVRPAGVG